MFNLILTIFTLPFIPFFLYGNLYHNLKPANIENVLGEATQIQNNQQISVSCDNQPVENYTIFPLDAYSGSGEYTPIRKPDYRDIKIWSGSSVAIDVDSGTILEYGDGRKQTQIASLTKIMTAVLAVENIKNLDEVVTLTSEALHVDGTTVGCPTSVFCNSEPFHVGEKVSARNVLKSMLLDSANDAATALAIHIAGTPDNFVKIMNQKAQDLGLKDTNFCTPSGLEINGEEKQCYSSAYDIARIAAYSLKYSLIWDIMREEGDQFTSIDGKYTHDLKNTDLLLSQMPDCIGGKTGFTPMAGKSLLMGAADPTKKHRIIAVILDDPDRWQDMQTLVKWVFDNYEWR